MKLRISIALCILGLLLGRQRVFAAEITCEVFQEKNNITISGVISGQTEVCDVALLVGGRNSAVYAKQITSAATGEFEFSFFMPEYMESGTYEFEIGSNAETSPYRGVFEYSKYVPQITCNPVQVQDKNITISGTVQSYDDLNLLWMSVSRDGNVIYGALTTNTANGEFQFNFIMPEGAESGTYEFQINSNTVSEGYTGNFVYVERPKLFAEKTISGIAGQTFNVIVGGSNIKSLTDSLYTLTYNPEHIFIDINDALSKKDERVELILCEEGRIIFRISSQYASGQSEWNGAVKIFRVQFNSNYSGETTITLSYEDIN